MINHTYSKMRLLTMSVLIILTMLYLILNITATVFEFSINIVLIIVLLISSLLISMEAVRFMIKRNRLMKDENRLIKYASSKKKFRWLILIPILFIVNMVIAIANKVEELNISFVNIENTFNYITWMTSVLILGLILFSKLYEFMIFWLFITLTYLLFLLVPNLFVYLTVFIIGLYISIVWFTKVWKRKYVESISRG